MGAEESSTTRARLLVSAGAPDQSSGGLIRLPWQVYVRGRMFGPNAWLLTVMARGATGAPWPACPQPARVRAAATARAAEAHRDGRRTPRRIRSWPDVTLALSVGRRLIVEPAMKRTAK